MRKSNLIILFLSFVFSSGAQLIDSLQFFIHDKYSIHARLESRVSFIDHQLTKVIGVRAGLTFKRKLRLGCGIDWLKTNYDRGFNALGNEPVSRDFVQSDNTVVKKYYKLLYFCTYADFVFYKTNHWQLSVPVQLGLGASWFNDQRKYSMGNHAQKYFVLLYEPGIAVQYKITKWLGGGMDFCYRFALQNQTKSTVRLSSPSYAFKLIFLLDQLFFEVFPNSQISKDYGPAYW